ncbi:MAG: NAD(P)H-dependent glycerol-3-phosphate dehydrogenase [Actinomycetaceae bacterium]|nr:NAD(P)H-dependent glycerol-3-phosphate dehydrogenase [Actinomycetaceae bacterium]
MAISTVAIMGTGAWGTTFAQVLADTGVQVKLWGRSEETVAHIRQGANPKYLPGVQLSNRISATTDLKQALQDADLLVVAVPTQTIRTVLNQWKRQILEANVPVLTLSKGIEDGTGLLVTQVVADVLGLPERQVAALSGPNLAREIIAMHPTATVIAATDLELARSIVAACHNDYFRPYVTADVVGAEVAGASKNVIALAVGAAEGMGWGINTRATLITRGLAEMTRLGIAMGAQADTFAGLAGMGDLVATCSSHLSRNYSFGLRIGQGLSLGEATKRSAGVVEGARTAGPLVDFARSIGVSMPISEAVRAVVETGVDVNEMGQRLLQRPAKMDGWRLQNL